MLNPHPRPRSAHERVAEHIREHILLGHWVPGQAIPKEHDLAAELGYSRLTVRAGIAMLVAEDLLEANPALGTFVKSWQRYGSMRVLEWLLLMFIGVDADGMTKFTGQLLWLRRTFYSSVCELLLRKKGLKALHFEVQSIQQLFRKDGGIPTEVLQEEERLLAKIAEASGNLFVTMQAHSLRRLMEVLNRSAEARLEITDETSAFGALLDTLEAGDLPAAEAAMKKVCLLREAHYLALAKGRSKRRG
ncbi:MAG: FadR family transcriptional regulator [Myxococcaceae bacterium]|nr:FadR family transcriptional regulator [Myxococcaceae bacterium]